MAAYDYETTELMKGDDLCGTYELRDIKGRPVQTIPCFQTTETARRTHAEGVGRRILGDQYGEVVLVDNE